MPCTEYSVNQKDGIRLEKPNVIELNPHLALVHASLGHSDEPLEDIVVAQNFPYVLAVQGRYESTCVPRKV